MRKIKNPIKHQKNGSFALILQEIKIKTKTRDDILQISKKIQKSDNIKYWPKFGKTPWCKYHCYGHLEKQGQWFPEEARTHISYNSQISYASLCPEKLEQKSIPSLFAIVTTGENPNIHQYMSLKNKLCILINMDTFQNNAEFKQRVSK